MAENLSIGKKEQLPPDRIIDLKQRFAQDPSLLTKLAVYRTWLYVQDWIDEERPGFRDGKFTLTSIEIVVAHVTDAIQRLGEALSLPGAQWPEEIISTVDLAELLNDYQEQVNLARVGETDG